MHLNSRIKKLLMLLLVVYINWHKVDRESLIDIISTYGIAFFLFYLVYITGMENLKEKAVKKKWSSEVLLSKEKYWKILFSI